MNIEIVFRLNEDQVADYAQMLDSICGIDTFSADCAGSFLRGVACCEDSQGRPKWIAREEDQPPVDENKLRERFFQGNLDIATLPPGYHLFDHVFAARVMTQGILKHGEGFFDGTADASDLASAIKAVLFGDDLASAIEAILSGEEPYC